MTVIKKEFFLRREIVDLPPLLTPISFTKPNNLFYKGLDQFRNVHHEGDFADVNEAFKEELKGKRTIRLEEAFCLKDFIGFGDIEVILRMLLQNLLIFKREGKIIDIKLKKEEYKVN